MVTLKMVASGHGSRGRFTDTVVVQVEREDSTIVLKRCIMDPKDRCSIT